MKKLPILRMHMNARANYLSPEPIYALNRVLGEILDEIGRKTFNFPVVPMLYAKRSRTWHYACVSDHVWEDKGPSEKFLTESARFLVRIAGDESLCRQLSKLKGYMLEKKDYQESWEWVNDCVTTLKKSLGNGVPKNWDDYRSVFSELKIQDRYDELLRKLLLFYFGIKNHRRLYLSGTLYHGLKTSPAECVLDRLDVELKPQAGKGGDKGGIESTFCFFEPGNPLTGPNSQIIVRMEGGATVKESEWGEHRGADVSFWITHPFYFNDVSGKGAYVTVLPIHDVWLGNVGYGGIWGSLICTFATLEDRKQFTDSLASQEHVASPLDKLRSACEVLSAELFASALVSAASLPIKPPYDLIEHFVRILIHLQDWDRVTVSNEGKKLYCYRRTLPCLDGSPDYLTDYDWQRCDGSACEKNGNCSAENDQGQTRTLTWDKKKIKCDIWSPEIVPELASPERDRFKDYELEFEYPATSTVPVSRGNGDQTHELFELAVVQQQIEVLRTIIPKVQARRAALRSAVSAIMGRNMSHNIGSHVLARYASVIKKDLDETHKDRTDHRTDFLSYLQRRMDFLAEIATSDDAFWSQPLSIKDQLGRLNYEKQCGRFFKTGETFDTKEKKNRPILLSYITGKESLSASAEYGKPTACPSGSGNWISDESKDFWFSCPGGEVGVHALYVILENIVRNSARHGSDSDSDRVSIFVFVDEDNSTDELIKLVVVDPRTKLDVHGQIDGSVASEDALSTEKQEVEAGIHSVYYEEANSEGKRKGQRKRRLCLHNEINSILKGEPFLDPNGSPNTQYWGVREIQISAQYLRRFPLSDLETTDTPPIQAGVYDLPGGKHCLKYTFYVNRPKNVAIVSSAAWGNFPEYLDGQGVIVVWPALFQGKEGTTDWNPLAAKVRGYEFLVTDMDLSSCPPGKLPIRQLKLDFDEINTLMEKPTVAEILAFLHARCADVYRNRNGRAAYWGTQEIISVVGWEPPKPPAPRPTTAIGRFSSMAGISHVQSWLSGDGEGFIGLLGDEQQLRATRDAEPSVNVYEKWVGVGWLDHPVEDDLVNVHNVGGHCSPRAPYFGGVSIPCDDSQADGQTYEQVSRWIAVEPCWSDSPQTAVLNNLLRQVEELTDETLENASVRCALNELICAAIPRVIVLDERVQSRRFDRVRAVTLYKYWPMVGIWAPLSPDDKALEGDESNFIEALGTPRCDLDHPREDAVKKFLKTPTLLEHQGNADFLLVHLTILEKLKRPDESIDQTLKRLVEGTLAEKAIKVILSGRGVPAEVRPHSTSATNGVESGFGDARFMPVSAVLEYLVTRPSKLGLMRALWSA